MKGLLACVLACFAAGALAAEQVLTIPTREGVTVSYLLVAPPGATPRVAVVSLIGGRGVLNLQERSAKGPLRFGPGANVLVRMRESFAAADTVDVLVDAPSDRLAEGMDDGFRMSPMHAQDVAAVVDDVRRRYPDVRVFLVGTSRGTISAASIAARDGKRYAGVVLSSTVTVPDRSGPNLSRFDFASLHVPALLVHHHDDGCRSSPYRGAQRLSAQFPLITVEGGEPARSDACEPQAPHGYLGREAVVAAAITRWIETGAVTPTVP